MGTRSRPYVAVCAAVAVLGAVSLASGAPAQATQTKQTSAYAEAFIGSNGLLSVNGASGNGSFPMTVDPKTHPAIVEVNTPAHGYQVFAAGGGVLQTWGVWGHLDLGGHLAVGTSPAVAALPTSPPSLEVVWHGANGLLSFAVLTNSDGTVTTTSGSVANAMAIGSSPDITTFTNSGTGGVLIAFATSSGDFWERNDPVGHPYNPSYNTSTWVVAAGTSPTLACVSGSDCVAAFQGANGHLWDYGFTYSGDLGYGMATGSSPSIADEGNTYVLAFNANSLKLWRLYFTLGSGGLLHQNGGTQLGVGVGTSPSVAAAAETGIGGTMAPSYRIAFDSPQGVLWYVAHTAMDTTPLSAFTAHETKATMAPKATPAVG